VSRSERNEAVHESSPVYVQVVVDPVVGVQGLERACVHEIRRFVDGVDVVAATALALCGNVVAERTLANDVCNTFDE